MSVLVYKMGQRVKTKIGSIEALITGVCMRNNTSYELSYFVGGQHYSIWLFDYEFEPMQEKKQAGFRYEDPTALALLD